LYTLLVVMMSGAQWFPLRRVDCGQPLCGRGVTPAHAGSRERLHEIGRTMAPTPCYALATYLPYRARRSDRAGLLALRLSPFRPLVLAYH